MSGGASGLSSSSCRSTPSQCLLVVYHDLQLLFRPLQRSPAKTLPMFSTKRQLSLLVGLYSCSEIFSQVTLPSSLCRTRENKAFQNLQIEQREPLISPIFRAFLDWFVYKVYKSLRSHLQGSFDTAKTPVETANSRPVSQRSAKDRSLLPAGHRPARTGSQPHSPLHVHHRHGENISP